MPTRQRRQSLDVFQEQNMKRRSSSSISSADQILYTSLQKNFSGKNLTATDSTMEEKDTSVKRSRKNSKCVQNGTTQPDDIVTQKQFFNRSTPRTKKIDERLLNTRLSDTKKTQNVSADNIIGIVGSESVEVGPISSNCVIDLTEESNSTSMLARYFTSGCRRKRKRTESADDDVIFICDSIPDRTTSNKNELYTLIREVRGAYQCEEEGERQELNDDVTYMLGGVKVNQQTKVRCLSLLRMADRCHSSVFRMYLKAHDILSKVFIGLQDVLSNKTVGLCLSYLMYRMSSDCLTALDKDTASLKSFLLVLKMDLETKDASITAKSEIQTKKSTKITGKSRSHSVPKKRLRKSGVLKEDGGEKEDKLFNEMRQTIFNMCCTGSKNVPEFKSAEELTVTSLLLRALKASSGRVSDWCRQAFRTHGGLQLISDTVIQLCWRLKTSEKYQVNTTTVQEIQSTVKLLYDLSGGLSESYQCICSHRSNAIVSEMMWLIEFCIKNMNNDRTLQTRVTMRDCVQTDCGEVEKEEIECLMSCLRLVVSLTEVQDAVSSVLYSSTFCRCLLEALMNSEGLNFPQESVFDFHVLVFNLLSHILKGSKDSCQLFVNIKIKSLVDRSPNSSRFINCRTSLQVLCTLFSSYQQSVDSLEARLHELNGDDFTHSDIETLPSADITNINTAIQKSCPKKQKRFIPSRRCSTLSAFNRVDTISEVRACGKTTDENGKENSCTKQYACIADKHMKKSIVSAYCSIIIGIILTNNQNLKAQAASFLPEGNLSQCIKAIKHFQHFMSTVVTKDTLSDMYVERIVSFMEKLSDLITYITSIS